MREPAAGFASRLAALNGRDLYTFLREMRVHPRTVDKAEMSALHAVAKLGGVNKDVLVRWTPIPVSASHFEVAGERFGRLAVSRTYFRFCPHCIEDDLGRFEGPPAARPWLRLEWTLQHYRSCQKHNVLLEAASPRRRPFAPFDFNETIAEILPRLSVLKAKALAVPPSPFQNWLGHRLSGRKDTGTLLDRMSLYAAADFCEALGLSALHPPKVKTGFLQQLDWAAAADEGYRIASGGIPRLHALLKNLNEAQADQRGVWGPRDTFGYVYGHLHKTMNDEQYEEARNLVREFALNSIPIEPGTDVLGVTAGKRRIHTVRTFSRDTGLHPLTVRNLFVRMGLTSDRDSSGLMDHRVAIASDELDILVERFQDALTAPQVEKLFGVPRLHLQALIEFGYLQPLPYTGERAYGKKKISLRDVEMLRERLFESATEIVTPKERQMNIFDCRRASTATLEQLLEMIFNNRVWKGRMSGRSDYFALVLDADEITRLVRSDSVRHELTRQETATYIPGMGRQTVSKLIESGHLTEVEEYSPDARRLVSLVSRVSADEFKSRYIALGELVQKSGLHHKKVRLSLKSVGIQEVFDAKTIGTFFYARSAVENAEARNPHLWHYDKESLQRIVRDKIAKEAMPLASD